MPASGRSSAWSPSPPPQGFVTVRESIVIGLVASVVSNLAVSFKTKSTLDDTLDVFPCHGVGGMVGMIATGVFAKDVGLVYGKTETFMNHMIALVVVAVFSFVGSLILYKLTDLIIPLLSTEDHEFTGLDLSQHGETALAVGALTNGNGQQERHSHPADRRGSRLSCDSYAPRAPGLTRGSGQSTGLHFSTGECPHLRGHSPAYVQQTPPRIHKWRGGIQRLG